MNKKKYVMPSLKSAALRDKSKRCLCASLNNGDNGQTQYNEYFDNDEDCD